LDLPALYAIRKRYLDQNNLNGYNISLKEIWPILNASMI
jgi:hypothetical protein